MTPQSLSQPPVIHLPQQSQFLPEHPEGTKYSNRACGSHSYSDQHRGVLKTLAGISSGIGTKGLTFPTVCIRFNRRAQPQDFMGCSTEKKSLRCLHLAVTYRHHMPDTSVGLSSVAKVSKSGIWGIWGVVRCDLFALLKITVVAHCCYICKEGWR